MGAGLPVWRGGWGGLLSLPLWEWAPPWVRSKPCPLRWSVDCSTPPRIVLVRGGPRKICQGSPPMLRGVHLGGGLVMLVARLGAPCSNLVARMGTRCLLEPLRKIRQGSPPLLRGVQEGGALMGLLARVGAHQVPLVARVGARGIRAVRRPIR